MKEVEKAQMHTAFNVDIYKWTLTIPCGKWFPIAPKKMTVEEFTDCIKYLINCGEQLELSEDFSAFRRIEPPDIGYVR